MRILGAPVHSSAIYHCMRIDPLKQWISFERTNILTPRYSRTRRISPSILGRLTISKQVLKKGATKLPDRIPDRKDNGEGTRGLSKVANITILTIVLALVFGGLLWWVDAYILHT